MSARVKLEDGDTGPGAYAVSSQENIKNNDDDDDDDDDDDIVREIDVYLCPSLASHMYLLQYPLQHGDDRLAATPPQQARIKLKHCILEIDHQLPRSMELLDTSEYSAMDQRTFESQTIPLQTHMCLGKVSNNKLLMVPLTHIFQMRPSFKHVDEREALTSTSTTEEAERAESAAMKAKEKKPLTFQKKETERAAIARKSSYNYKIASEGAEEWTNLTVHPDDAAERTTIMETLKDEMVNAKIKRSILNMSQVDKSEYNDATYVRSLNYMPVTSVGPTNIHYEGRDLRSVAARLTMLLHSGSPIPYSILRAQFDQSKFSDDKLITALSACAVMVRGNYCLNSKYITTLTENLKRARTFLLLLFQLRQRVERSRLAQVFEPRDNDDYVTLDSLLVLLNHLGAKTDGGWALKIEEDVQHTVRFPGASRLHDAYWASQEQRFQREITLYDQSILHRIDTRNIHNSLEVQPF